MPGDSSSLYDFLSPLEEAKETTAEKSIKEPNQTELKQPQSHTGLNPRSPPSSRIDITNYRHGKVPPTGKTKLGEEPLLLVQEAKQNYNPGKSGGDGKEPPTRGRTRQERNPLFHSGDTNKRDEGEITPNIQHGKCPNSKQHNSIIDGITKQGTSDILPPLPPPKPDHC
ncbi:hypothetical protein O181_089957 [Austropuccinia psidii MF-1]|uniref:Uncharacterized protein n=1 Tax=Austropuccinia psidii MF-1 TaxID=1389203 RepID=A0A9Q3IUF6_9BASI|nr:hypothetical protein [Austropuccinia psidii MF-1]